MRTQPQTIAELIEQVAAIYAKASLGRLDDAGESDAESTQSSDDPLPRVMPSEATK